MCQGLAVAGSEIDFSKRVDSILFEAINYTEVSLCHTHGSMAKKVGNCFNICPTTEYVNGKTVAAAVPCDFLFDSSLIYPRFNVFCAYRECGELEYQAVHISVRR